MDKHGLRTAEHSATAAHFNKGCDGGYAAEGGRDG